MSRDRNGRTIGIVLIAVGCFGLISFSIWSATSGYSQWSGTMFPMMGPMSGMMSGNGSTGQGELTIDQAIEIAEDYLASLGNEDQAIDEIMEFELNFYIIYYEKSTGIGAFEMIIDKQDMGGMMMGTNDIRPEQGPNMMWNTKYGMHDMMGSGMIRRGSDVNNHSINEDQAIEYAQQYLDTSLPSSIAEDVHPFYGYYTIHIMMDERIYGMLSVNSYTGQVWYHNWHGNYSQTQELPEE